MTAGSLFFRHIPQTPCLSKLRCAVSLGGWWGLPRNHRILRPAAAPLPTTALTLPSSTQAWGPDQRGAPRDSSTQAWGADQAGPSSDPWGQCLQASGQTRSSFHARPLGPRLSAMVTLYVSLARPWCLAVGQTPVSGLL